MRHVTRLTRDIALVIALAGLMPGCSWLRGACADAMPAIAQVQTYGTDAEAAIDEAAAIASELQVDQATTQKLLAAIDKCRQGLRTGMSLLDAAASACSQPDATTIFADLVAAWNAFEQLLPASSLLGATPSALPRATVRPPRVVLLARTRAIR